MTEPTEEFKALYAEFGRNPNGTARWKYFDAWWWFQQGEALGHHKGFQDAREQRARHDLGQHKP